MTVHERNIQVETTSEKIFMAVNEMGLTVPTRLTPNGNYRTAKFGAGLIFVSGQLSRTKDERKVLRGPIGPDDPLDVAIEAAKVCFVRALVAMHDCLGDLGHVTDIMHIRGFINGATDFSQHSQVMDHVSDMAIALFGPDVGSHSRTALGAGSLPSNGLVEVEVVAAARRPEREQGEMA